MWPRLALSSWYTYLSSPSAGITVVCHYTQFETICKNQTKPNSNNESKLEAIKERILPDYPRHKLSD
jgi:hypothetical protein